MLKFKPELNTLGVCNHPSLSEGQKENEPEVELKDEI